MMPSWGRLVIRAHGRLPKALNETRTFGKLRLYVYTVNYATIGSMKHQENTVKHVVFNDFR